MKVHDAYVDDNGVRYELWYDEKFHYEEREGKHIALPNTIENLRWQREGETDLHPLPTWVEIPEGVRINCCWFDENKETGELTFWKVTS